MYTRDDIRVYRSVDQLHNGDTYFVVEIKVGDKVYGSSFARVEDAGVAIDMLIEMVMRKQLGIDKQDFIMQMSNFFYKEKQSAEEGSNGREGKADGSSEGST